MCVFVLFGKTDQIDTRQANYYRLIKSLHSHFSTKCREIPIEHHENRSNRAASDTDVVDDCI